MKKLYFSFFIFFHFTLPARNNGIVYVSNTNYGEITLLIISMVIIAVLIYSNIQLKKKEELSRQLLQQQKIRSKSIIATEERERSRIARELNDGIGQQLSAAKLNISALQSFFKNTTDAEKLMLQNAVEQLDDSVKQVRNISYSIIPNTLIKSGLTAALQEFIKKMNSAGNLKINLEIVGSIDKLAGTGEITLFKVIQEVVYNSIKHANASEIALQLVKHEKELSILVQDNGNGFDVEGVQENGRGNGLKNILSRVDFLNGNVYFDSMPTKGTTVTIEIPM